MVGGLLLTGAAACTDRPTGPGTEAGPAGPPDCSAECVLLAGMPAFEAARVLPDSAEVPVPLGDFSVQGHPGAQISLFLAADPALLEAIGSGVQLLVEQGGTVRRYGLAELRHGVTVHTFARSGVVDLRYALERQVAAAPPDGRLLLTQRLSGAAVVRFANRRWLQEPAAMTSLQAAEVCAITAPVTSGCGNTATTSPFVATGFLGATFKSDPGTGASRPITITFARPVTSVTIRIVDSDFAGNQAVALDGQGQVGAVSFSFDNQPANDAINETQTITAPPGRGIKTVQLIPAANDFVAYNASWEGVAPCPPTGDPLLDQPGWRQAAERLLADANRNIPVGDRREAVDYVVRDDATGEVSFQPSPQPTACYGSFINTADRIQASLPAGQTLIGIVHSHVIFAGEDVSGCRGGFPPYDPDALGGGSPQDWLYVNNPLNADVRVYSVSPDRIHYLPPGLTDAQSQLGNNAANGYDNDLGCARR